MAQCGAFWSSGKKSRGCYTSAFCVLEKGHDVDGSDHRGPRSQWNQAGKRVPITIKISGRVRRGFCDRCGQPMLPPGVEKRPFEYDHASGCPLAPKEQGE